MSARVSMKMVSSDPTGGPGTATPVAVKTATTPHEVDRLAAEADRLRELRHPGLVSLIDHRIGTGSSELLLQYVGEPLTSWRGTAEQAVGVIAAVAATLAEIHDAGFVHGRLDRSHVLLGPEGRPVLCGLSPPDDHIGPADDVAALGHLLDDLLTSDAVDAAQGRWRRPVRRTGPRRRLAHAVDLATDPDPGRRPTARALAHAVVDAVPDATLPPGPPPDDVEPDPAPPAPDPFLRAFVDQRDSGEHEVFDDRPWASAGTSAGTSAPPTAPSGGHRRPMPAAVTGGVAIVLLAAAGSAVAVIGFPSDRADRSDRPRPDGTPAAVVEGAPEQQTTPEPSCPDRPTGPEDADGADEVQVVDVTGDGCPDRVRVTDDAVIETTAGRWAVGEPGDLVVLGDWDCSGRATPALYRTATGDVFVFDGWAEDTRPRFEAPVARVEGGVALVNVRAAEATGLAADPAACDVPAVVSASGDRQPVEVTP